MERPNIAGNSNAQAKPSDLGAPVNAACCQQARGRASSYAKDYTTSDAQTTIGLATGPCHREAAP
jgi:hypothetical protein